MIKGQHIYLHNLSLLIQPTRDYNGNDLLNSPTLKATLLPFTLPIPSRT